MLTANNSENMEIISEFCLRYAQIRMYIPKYMWKQMKCFKGNECYSCFQETIKIFSLAKQFATFISTHLLQFCIFNMFVFDHKNEGIFIQMDRINLLLMLLI